MIGERENGAKPEPNPTCMLVMLDRSNTFCFLPSPHVFLLPTLKVVYLDRPGQSILSRTHTHTYAHTLCSVAKECKTKLYQ